MKTSFRILFLIFCFLSTTLFASITESFDESEKLSNQPSLNSPSELEEFEKARERMSFFKIGELGEGVDEKTTQWAKFSIREIEKVFSELTKREKRFTKNIGQFRLVAKIGDYTLTKTFEKEFFISGESAYCKKNIDDSLGRIICMSDYKESSTDPSDYFLRKKIIDFFEFEEDKVHSILMSSSLSTLEGAIKSQLTHGNIIKDFKSQDLNKLLNLIGQSFDKTACRRFFTDESNERALKLGLFQKSKALLKKEKSFEKGGCFLDGLFAEFVHNFGDSEQIMRLFLQAESGRLKFDFMKGFLLNDVKEFLAFAEKNLNDSAMDLPDVELSMDVTSYFNSCPNCQVTFQYLISERKSILSNIFRQMIKNTFLDFKDDFSVLNKKFEMCDPLQNIRVFFIHDYNL